ncbi:hypothetical protein FE257_002135 [Aspergillus nanangensis]|uniref:Phenazine biosynthesis-like protein n=1 Tax=Aspergillus nanangensis TaxID=2582783 RepID=A0AAD4CTW5_ASPNN|nr:hypothetical protein FE257_002135 [Aspergillus nanangensis]
MAQQVNFVTLDVFTSKPYSGNPLAVVFLPEPGVSKISQSQKLTIAKQFNLSETVFLHPASWFQYLSPNQQDKGEVECLVTKSGDIPISLQSGSAGNSVVAQIAHNVRLHAKGYPLRELLRLHGSLAPYLADRKANDVSFPVFSVVNGMSQIHIELPSLEALSAVTASNGGEMVDEESGYLDEGWRNGHCVLYFYVPGVYDEQRGTKVIRTRMILGNLEDPATGSAASGLVAYLAMKEGSAGTYKHHIVQGVEMGRRSDIGIEIVINGKSQVERLDLKGAVVQVAEGNIRIPQE